MGVEHSIMIGICMVKCALLLPSYAVLQGEMNEQRLLRKKVVVKSEFSGPNLTCFSRQNCLALLDSSICHVYSGRHG